MRAAWVLSSGVVALQIMPGQAVAQSVGASPAEQPNEIVVTATGRRLAAEKVPYNVTARSEKDLRENNITDIKKLIALSPSINAPGNGARFADSVTVRGLNVSPVNANNIEQFARSTLAYYLDDTPLPNIAYRIKDISRVETLLGPQGTLYGAGSLGGTVRFITNQPEFGRTLGRISTSIYQVQGGGLSHDTDAMINLPLGPTLALRGAVSRLDDAGYTDRVSNPFFRAGPLAWATQPDAGRNLYKNDDYDRVTSGRLALAWQVSPRVKVTIAHAHQYQLAHGTTATSLLPVAIANATSPADYDSYVHNPDLPCNTNCQYSDADSTPRYAGYDVVLARYPEFARRKFQLTSGDLDFDLGFAKLHSSTSYFKDTRVGQADYAGQGYVFYYTFGDSGGAFDSGRSAYITFDNSFSGINHETRLTSTGTGPFSWVAGLYYTSTKRNFRFSEFLPGIDAYIPIDRAAAGGNLDEGYRENLGDRYKEGALYGELSYRPTPRLNLTVGGRVFKYQSHAISEIRDYSLDLVDNNVDVTRKSKIKAIFKGNASFDLTPTALVYATVSQGFRRGGTNGFRDVGTKTIAPSTQSYQPDTTTNYEVGLKGSFLDRHLFLQLDAYQIDWKNVQTYYSQDIGGFPVNGTTNGPNARSRGFEGIARVQLAGGLSASASTSYTKAKWSSTRQVCLYTDGSGCRDPWLKGGLLGGAPRWKHSGDLRYTTQLRPDVSGFVDLSGRYVGKVQIDRSDDPLTTVRAYPSYAIFDARAGVNLRNIDITLWVENFANKRAIVSRQRDRVLGTRLFYTTPRTYGVNLSYRF